ncbi:MAG: nucleotidyltransferase family protein [Desulfobacterales bacterium]
MNLQEAGVVASLSSSIRHWETLVSAAGQEGLDGLLYVQLRRTGAVKNADPTSMGHLRRRYEQTAIANLHRIRELLLIREKSAAAGISFILLKGMALLATTYKDIGLRAMGDIDIWVSPADCLRFSSLLIAEGYDQDRLYPTTFRKNRTVIDLHSHPLGADRIRSRRFLLRTKTEIIFQRARPVRFMGEIFFCPADFDHAIILSIHALKHGLQRLIWVADILNLTDRWGKKDWIDFRRWCEKTGGEKLVGRTFAAMDVFFSDQGKRLLLPSMGKWMPSRLDRKLLALCIDRAMPPFWVPAWLMRPQRNLFIGGLYFAETLFPNPSVLRQIFPRWSRLPAPVLYVLRFFQVLFRAAQKRWGKHLRPPTTLAP